MTNMVLECVKPTMISIKGKLVQRRMDRRKHHFENPTMREDEKFHGLYMYLYEIHRLLPLLLINFEIEPNIYLRFHLLANFIVLSANSHSLPHLQFFLFNFSCGGSTIL